ncbi:MAG: cysteine desulfurase [Ignavibacteriales bacterium]|nr:cysteine desulfurase [Ignavibacteriales bacterium]
MTLKQKSNNQIIYLDNNATTKIDPKVVEAMLPYFNYLYANPASKHKFGESVDGAIMEAREKIANLISSATNEIIFTSGATEAINLAIKGVAESYSDKGKHIITVKTEHRAVLDVCKYLETKGFEITYLSVEKDGLLNLDDLRNNLRKETIIVSVMLVNNEIGVIQPIKEIANIVHDNGSIFMTDATQAVGKIPINIDDLDIDLMTFSGHKFYGPKGIGGLYIRSRRPRKIKLLPLIHGGGHERGYRSGTLNVPGIIGLGKAAEIALQEMETNKEKIKEFRDYLEFELLKLDETFLNGNNEKRIYNTSNICFKGVNAHFLIERLKNIFVSNGSACSSASIQPPHVLRAIGLSDIDAFSSIRFSLGKFNTKIQINTALDTLRKEILRLKKNKTNTSLTTK